MGEIKKPSIENTVFQSILTNKTNVNEVANLKQDTVKSYGFKFTLNEVANLKQDTVKSYDFNVTSNNEVASEITEVIPNLYQNVIISTQEELGNNANLEQLSSAFTTLLGENGISKIASNAEDAVNGNFIESANILTPYWTDKPLKFELQENGSYLISQMDEEGNYIAMGYTTADAAVAYLKGLDSMVNHTENETTVTDSANDGKSEESSGGVTAPADGIGSEEGLDGATGPAKGAGSEALEGNSN